MKSWTWSRNWLARKRKLPSSLMNGPGTFRCPWRHARLASPRQSCHCSSRWYSLKGWRMPRPGTFWANLAASSWQLWQSSWSLSLHSQLRDSSCEDSQQGIEHFNSGGFHCLSLEAMGCSLQLCGQQGGTPSPGEHMLRGSRQQFTSSEIFYNKIIECIHLPLE